MQGVSTDNIDWDNLAAFFFNLLPHQHSAADIKRLTELSEATAHYSPMLRAAVEDFALASFWEQHTGKQFQCRYSVFALIYVVFILPLIHQHLTVHARSRPLLKQDTVHYACSRSQAMWWPHCAQPPNMTVFNSSVLFLTIGQMHLVTRTSNTTRSAIGRSERTGTDEAHSWPRSSCGPSRCSPFCMIVYCKIRFVAATFVVHSCCPVQTVQKVCPSHVHTCREARRETLQGDKKA